MKSIFIDLKYPLRFQALDSKSVAAEIFSPENVRLKAFSFPNGSLCSDLLVDKNTLEWIGVAVSVSDEDFETVRIIVDEVRGRNCDLLLRPGGTNPLYADFPDLNWLQISWSNLSSAFLLDVQTDGILWYSEVFEGRLLPSLSAMVLEDVPHIISESGEALKIGALESASS